MSIKIIDTSSPEGQKEFEVLERSPAVAEKVDLLEIQLAELFEIDNPPKLLDKNLDELKKQYIEQEMQRANELSVWVFMPWNGRLIRTLREKNYTRLRTNRNQNLVTVEEQEGLYNSTVAVCGLSVGNSIALGLVQSGIAKQIVLADFDLVETANLNRLRAGLHQIGKTKLEIATQQIYELNPFASIKGYSNGISEENIDEFLSNPMPGVVFDEIDDFKMKIILRLKARKLGIPVVMLTSLGDSVLVDVDRYDLDKNTPLFNGLIGDTPEEILGSEIGEKEKVKFAITLVGVEHIPTRALGSLFEINKTLVGRPQLGSTIMIDGGLAAYVVRKILTGKDSQPLKGRHFLSISDICGLSESESEKQQRKDIEKIMQGLLG